METLKKFIWLFYILLCSGLCYALEIDSQKSLTIVHQSEVAPKYLSFEARIDTEKFQSGGAFALAVRLNNYSLSEFDLVNRASSLKRGKQTINLVNSGGLLFLNYANFPIPGENHKKLFFHHRYVFRIDEIAQKHKNTLQLYNAYTFIKNAKVEIRNIKWGSLSEIGLKKVSQKPSPAVRIAPDIVIPIGETHIINVPSFKGRYLAFSARIKTDKWSSGAAPALTVNINGVPLNSSHLVNKGAFFHFRKDKRIPWVHPINRIMLCYYPWYMTTRLVDKHFVHDFVFDINGLTKGSNNQIELINKFGAFANSAIEVRDLRILDKKENFPIAKCVNEKELGTLGAYKLRKQALSLHGGVNKALSTADDYEVFNSPKEFDVNSSLQSTAYTLTDNGDGFLQVKSNSETLNIKSTWQVYNKVIPMKNGQANGAGLSVTRRIEKSPYGFIVRDTLKNNTDNDLPVVYNHAHQINLSRLNQLFVSGSKLNNFAICSENIKSRQYSATPLIYFGYPHNKGFGIYLEDDCYRNHFSAIAVNDTLNLVDDMFYLTAHKEYTTVWRVYPISQGYYSLLNTLRQDYNLFQNIPGLFGFIYRFKNSPKYERYYKKKLDTKEKICEFFNNTGINIPASVGEPMLYGSEPTDVWQKSIEPIEKFKKELRSAGLTKMPFLNYCDVHLIATKGQYDINSKSKWTERLADSVIKDEQNNIVPYRSGILYHVAPQMDNSAGKQILKNIRFILDKDSRNGMFFDEWNHSVQRVAWNFDDKCTALLDEDGKIAKKVAIIPIYSQDFLLKVGTLGAENGRVAYANQFDSTLKLMQLPIVHFAEPVAHEDNYLTRAAQAGRTPLSLSCKRGTTVWGDVKYFLRYGVVVCFYAKRIYGEHVLKDLYPLTVRKIYPGVVIGDDKILTNRSGKYSFAPGKKLLVKIYKDPNGQLVKTQEIETNSVDLELDNKTEVALIISQ